MTTAVTGFKLTSKDGWTRQGEENACQWGAGITHKATGKGKVLCSEDCIHDYKSPVHAVLFNPLGVNFSDPILWEGEGKVLKADDGTKRGWGEYTTIKQIPLSDISLEKKVEFAIRLVKKVYPNDVEWNKWADKWLSREDRTKEAARVAEAAARVARAAWVADPQLIDETIKETFGELPQATKEGK